MASTTVRPPLTSPADQARYLLGLGGPESGSRSEKRSTLRWKRDVDLRHAALEASAMTTTLPGQLVFNNKVEKFLYA